jgi:lipoprotein-anchoring transpeptidase ErfK/SrfK
MHGFERPERGLGSRVAAVAVLIGTSILLAACAGPQRTTSTNYKVDPAVVAMYAPVETEPFRVPAAPVRKIPPQFYRQVVQTPPNITQPPGTIVVDPQNRFLYLTQAGGTSMRYGIGVGRQGFSWSGEAVIKDKQHWPKWFPPKEMVERDPKAAPYANGMDGGIDNPLGARALYLWQGDKDTLYRLHGTAEPLSIGQAVSSGCVRMLNQDIMDLYERVPLGTRVVVLGGPDSMPVVNGAPVVAGATPATQPLPGTTASPYEPPVGPSVTGRTTGEPRPII